MTTPESTNTFIHYLKLFLFWNFYVWKFYMQMYVLINNLMINNCSYINICWASVYNLFNDKNILKIRVTVF